MITAHDIQQYNFQFEERLTQFGSLDEVRFARGDYAIGAIRRLANVHNVNPPSGITRAALRKHLPSVRGSGQRAMTHQEAEDAMSYLRKRTAGDLRNVRRTTEGRAMLSGKKTKATPSTGPEPMPRYWEPSVEQRRQIAARDREFKGQPKIGYHAVGGWA